MGETPSAYRSRSHDDLRGIPLTGRELLRLTGAATDGLPAWLSGRLDDIADNEALILEDETLGRLRISAACPARDAS